MHIISYPVIRLVSTQFVRSFLDIEYGAHFFASYTVVLEHSGK
jgi:hypothetical protein